MKTKWIHHNNNKSLTKNRTRTKHKPGMWEGGDSYSGQAILWRYPEFQLATPALVMQAVMDYWNQNPDPMVYDWEGPIIKDSDTLYHRLTNGTTYGSTTVQPYVIYARMV